MLNVPTSEAASWEQHWQPQEFPFDGSIRQGWERELDDAAELEVAVQLLDEEVLRQMCLSFKRRTGVAMNGIHVCHLALLTSHARVVLALLFQVIELIGYLPAQVQMLLIFLKPKATGGRRPIMLASAFYTW